MPTRIGAIQEMTILFYFAFLGNLNCHADYRVEVRLIFFNGFHGWRQRRRSWNSGFRRQDLADRRWRQGFSGGGGLNVGFGVLAS